jgi:hypothetical protein
VGYFRKKVVEKIKTTDFMFNECFRKPCSLCDNVGKYATAREAINKNIIRRRKDAIYVPDN